MAKYIAKIDENNAVERVIALEKKNCCVNFRST